MRVQRVLAGIGGVLVLALPQLVMPHEWVEVSGLGAHNLWRIAAGAIAALIFVPVLRLVSYRRRDWLVLAFVPVWQYVVAFRVAYRAALLPLRDWSARPDERLRVRRLRGTEFWVLLPETPTAPVTSSSSSSSSSSRSALAPGRRPQRRHSQRRRHVPAA